MSLITWDDSFSVNVKEIDTQHQRLIDLINQLHEAMKQGKGNTFAGPILKDLIDYTKIHFGTEEKYFEKFNYVETAPHKNEHKKFVDKVLT